MTRDYDLKFNSSEDFKRSIAMRKELPVFAKKDEILNVIQQNSVVIIQGSTGCGKTTQVNKNLIILLFFI